MSIVPPHSSKSNIVRDNPRKFMAFAALAVFAAAGAGEIVTLLIGSALFIYSFFAWLDYRRWDALQEGKHRHEEQVRSNDMRVRY